MKKFELTSEFVTFLGKKLFRIKALVSFGDVKEGELGGLVEKEENLDQSGNAWVYGNARISGDARVSGDAQVSGNARVCLLYTSFIESEYKDSTGRTLPCYLCTKKGCDMIANKMTGKKGVIFTATYIEAFEKMKDFIEKGTQMCIRDRDFVVCRFWRCFVPSVL